MLDDSEFAHHYRAPLKASFVRSVLSKREEERRQRALAAAAAERARFRAEHKALQEAVKRAREATRKAKEEAEAKKIDGRLSVREIIAHVAALHCLKAGDLVGPRRMKHIIEARHEAIRIVADLRPDLSLPQIGRVFNKDHTTILHALRKTKQEGQPR